MLTSFPALNEQYWYSPQQIVVTYKGQNAKNDLNLDFSHGRKGEKTLTLLSSIAINILQPPTEEQLVPIKIDILTEFLRLGNATVKELEDLTRAHPATIQRTIRLARRYGHPVVYSSDSDGGNRFYVDYQGHIPNDSGRGVNVVNAQDILAWIAANSGWWFDAQIAAGLGLDSNKHESVGAAVRALLQRGKLTKRYQGKLRQVSAKGEERTA